MGRRTLDEFDTPSGEILSALAAGVACESAHSVRRRRVIRGRRQEGIDDGNALGTGGTDDEYKFLENHETGSSSKERSCCGCGRTKCHLYEHFSRFGGAHSAHISKTRRIWLGLSYPEVGMRTPPVASATQVCYTVQQTLQHSWERNVAEGTYRGRRKQDRGRIPRSLRTTSVMIRTHDLRLLSKSTVLGAQQFAGR